MSKGLDEILSGNEPAQVEQPSAEPKPEPDKTDAQPRGEHGHFAPKEPKEPEPAPQPEPVETAQQPKGAPPGVLEERNRRKTAEDRAADLERQLAEVRGQVSILTQQRQQPTPTPQPAPEPPKPVDFWEDPNKFIEQALAPIHAERAQERFEQSVERSIAKYGEEACGAAEAALKAAVEAGQLNGEAVKAQLSRSRDPIGDIVRWHQQQPASIEARLRAEIEAKVRAELGGQQPNPAPVEQPPTPAPTNMPSNLVGQRNVGTRSGPAWSGPASINDIFDRSRAKKAG